MEAFVLHGPRDLRRETRKEREPAADEVVIDIRRAGICGSDIHYYLDFKIWPFIPKAPLVLGHEFSGVIVETGSSVTGFAPGDRVTVEPSLECGHCAYCRSGRYNLCLNLSFIGTASTVPHIDGGFAERITVPASHCYLLHDSLGFGDGALVEPLAVGAHAVARAGRVAGRKVLIMGGGTIGQMVLTMARAWGANDITLADPDEFARDFAVNHGACQVIDPRESGLAGRLYTGGGFEVVFEASGAPSALTFAYEAAARGGKVVQVGSLPAEVTLPANLVMARELTVLGSLRYAHVYPMVLEMLVAGRIDIEDMVSVVYPFDRMQEAVERAVEKDCVIKIQVERG